MIANLTCSCSPVLPACLVSLLRCAQYIVSDHVANIATSNMAWSYFRTTVGSSINVDGRTGQRGNESSRDIGMPQLVTQLRGVFERDWQSQYAHNLSEL